MLTQSPQGAVPLRHDPARVQVARRDMGDDPVVGAETSASWLERIKRIRSIGGGNDTEGCKAVDVAANVSSNHRKSAFFSSEVLCLYVGLKPPDESRAMPLNGRHEGLPAVHCGHVAGGGVRNAADATLRIDHHRASAKVLAEDRVGAVDVVRFSVGVANEIAVLHANRPIGGSFCPNRIGIAD